MVWFSELVIKPAWEAGPTIGQLIAVLFGALAVYLLTRKDVFGAVACLVLSLLFAGVPVIYVAVIGFAGLLLFLWLFRLMSWVNIGSGFIMISILVTFMPAILFNSFMNGAERLERAAAKKGITLYGAPEAQTAEGTGNGSPTTEKVLRENAAAVWWSGLNRFPTEKPDGGFIPQGISCTLSTQDALLTTGVTAEKWHFRCWIGSQDEPSWESAEVVVNGQVARAAGATLKKGVTSQVSGYGEWPEAAYETRAVAAPSPVPTATATAESSSGATTTTYTVVAGDTLGRIATRFGVTVGSLAQANGIMNVNVISVGQVLTIPAK